MKTDTLFYRLFKIHPRGFFQLTGLDISGNYEFESITTKTTKKRFDGFLKGTDGAGPNIFSEFQGWDAPKIYWRIFREIFTYYEQTDTQCHQLKKIVHFIRRWAFDVGCRMFIVSLQTERPTSNIQHRTSNV